MMTRIGELRAGIQPVRWIAIATLWALTLGAADAGATLPPFQPVAPSVRTLPNGLTVAVWADHRLPIVQMQLLVPAGSASESSQELGLASLTAALVTRGTASRSGIEMKREVAALGGTLAGATTREFATLSGAFGAPDLGAGLELLADAALHPIFPDDAFNEAHARQLNALTRSRQDAAVVADEHVAGLAYGGDPLGHPPAGTIETLQAITIGDPRSFHRRFWRPDRALFAVAGDVDPEAVFRAVEEQFGAWTGKADSVAAGTGAPTRTRLLIRLVDEPGRARYEIRLALPGPGRSSPDVPALTVANALLGAGADSRLSRARVGLTPACALSLQRTHGLIVLGTSATADSVVAAVRALQRARRALASTPPTAAEVAATRATFRDAQAMQFETLGGLIGQWMTARANGLPDDQLQRYGERMDAVDAQAVAAVAQRWFGGGEGALVVAGSAREVNVALQALGTVEVVPANRPPVTVGRAPSRQTATPTAAEIERGRALVAKALTAHGGTLAISRITDSVQDGDLTIQLPDGTYHGIMREMRKQPDRYLLTTLIQNNPVQVGLLGKKGWRAGAGAGDSIADADSATVTDMRTSFASDLQHILLWATAPRTRLALRGQEPIDGRPCDVVEAVDAAGVRRVLFLEPGTHRLAAIEQLEVLADEGVSVRRVWGDYRPVAGIQWPYFEERRLLDRPLMTIQFKSVKLNTGLTDAAFAKPVSPNAKKPPGTTTPPHKP